MGRTPLLLAAGLACCLSPLATASPHTATAFGGTMAGQTGEAKGATLADSTRATGLAALPRLTADGLATSVSHPQLRPHWGLVGLGVLVALPLDGQVQEQALNDGLMPEGLARLGDGWGGLWAAATILPLITLAETMRGSPSEETRQRLAFAATSLAAVGITTAVMKEVVRRQRPNDAGHRSFPSGHTSAAFGVAEVIRTLYGRRNASVFYTLAAITAISRIHDNKHYLSDVAAGAGLAVGLVRGFALAQGRAVRFTITRLRVTPGAAELAISFSRAKHRSRPRTR